MKPSVEVILSSDQERSDTFLDELKTDGWHHVITADAGAVQMALLGLGKYSDGGFCDLVNQRNESGTLHPKAPISAIPLKIFKKNIFSTEHGILKEFERHIRVFLAINESQIKSKKVYFNFGGFDGLKGGQVPLKYTQHLKDILSKYDSNILETAVILEDDPSMAFGG